VPDWAELDTDPRPGTYHGIPFRRDEFHESATTAQRRSARVSIGLSGASCPTTLHKVWSCFRAVCTSERTRHRMPPEFGFRGVGPLSQAVVSSSPPGERRPAALKSRARTPRPYSVCTPMDSLRSWCQSLNTRSIPKRSWTVRSPACARLSVTPG